MHAINIGASIARERRAAGITQGELARFLGVTKAAVSKWELEQSIPDVVLLPRIASFFNLSLDRLFDYCPQLTKEQTQEHFLELTELLAKDADTACGRVDELVSDYYSCWPLLVQMGSLYMSAVLRLPQREDELMEKAKNLFERVEHQSGDVELVRAARFMRAMIMSQRGSLDEAIELVESIKPEKPFVAETILGALYQQREDYEASLELYQDMLFWSTTTAMSSLSMQLHLCAGNGARLDALLQAGEGMVQGFGLEWQGPSEALGFYGGAATVCLEQSDKDRAFSYLERFVDLLSTTSPEVFVGGNCSVLYDKIPEIAGGGPSLSRMAQAQFDLFDMKSQYKSLISSYEIWNERADDQRFGPLLDRLSDL